MMMIKMMKYFYTNSEEGETRKRERSSRWSEGKMKSSPLSKD